MTGLSAVDFEIWIGLDRRAGVTECVVVACCERTRLVVEPSTFIDERTGVDMLLTLFLIVPPSFARTEVFLRNGGLERGFGLNGKRSS
jgi:hypothetical protein